MGALWRFDCDAENCFFISSGNMSTSCYFALENIMRKIHVARVEASITSQCRLEIILALHHSSPFYERRMLKPGSYRHFYHFNHGDAIEADSSSLRARHISPRRFEDGN